LLSTRDAAPRNEGDRVRVIAGKYRSRPLQALTGNELRPTADRLRETLFNVFTAGNPSALEGKVWIDLYAGTGAVGIEAISRGCPMVHFIDDSAKAVDLIRRNLSSLKLQGGFEILKLNAAHGLRALEAKAVSADFIFLDPPYSMEQEYERTLISLASSSVVKGEGIVIAEHTKRFDPGEEFGLIRRYRKLVQGDAALSFYRK
jgi:16S rRNA (guanine966-N2)-methyltransferase